MISAVDAAKLYRTTIGYIYKLARRDRWRRIHHQRRVYYHLDDVDSSLGQDTPPQASP